MSYMPIEWGKIREYAVATGSSHPDYLENPNAPVPPTFLSTVVFWDQPGRGLQTPEATAALADIGADQDTDIRNVLSVEQEYRFHGPLPRAGDQLLLTASVRWCGGEGGPSRGPYGVHSVCRRVPRRRRDAPGRVPLYISPN